MKNRIKVGSREVGDDLPPYVIAEACINHQGDPGRAIEMVYVARAMNCDAIKFQYHVLDDEMLKHPNLIIFQAPYMTRWIEQIYLSKHIRS